MFTAILVFVQSEISVLLIDGVSFGVEPYHACIIL